MENNPVKVYEKSFYDNQSEGSYKSALEIVTILLNYISPKSVIDVGAGVGTWLKVLEDKGVKKIQAVEGEWVKDNALYIPQEKYVFQDLVHKINIKDKFDLAICMEVLEHIPDDAGRKIVSFLTKTAPLVLFSAAVPGQTGAIHINERWQSYWAKIFKDKGFVALDAIRPFTWNNPKVDFWYKQNTILFVKENLYKKDKKLKLLPRPLILNLVHPISYNIANESL
jgi:hypothetical protein